MTLNAKYGHVIMRAAKPCKKKEKKKERKNKTQKNLPPDGAKEQTIWTPFTNPSVYSLHTDM